MVLVRKGIAVIRRKGVHEPEEAAFWCYQIVRCKGYNVALVSVYFLPDDEAINTQTRLGITRFLQGYRGKYMLLGDWNMSPEQLSTCGWEVPGYSQYATPGDMAVTCGMGQGTMIDYGVASQALKHGMITHVEHNVPTSPHYGVVHSIRTDLCQVKTNQLLRPGKMRPDKTMIVCDRLDWATSSRIAQDISQFGQRGTEQRSLSHASSFGDPLISRELTEA